MDPFGTLLGLAHVLKRAHDLYTGCAAAPEEIQQAADYVHNMALVLEGVKSDLVANRQSFVHQTNAIAQTKKAQLKRHIGYCDRALNKMEALLKKYKKFKETHVRNWNKFRWSTKGKQEIAECKVELMEATNLLDIFLSSTGLSVLYKVEAMIEAFVRRVGAMELNPPPPYSAARPRAGSNVARTLIVSFVIARFKGVLMDYRWKKTANRKPTDKPPNPGMRRPRPVTRVDSGFKPNKNRDSLIKEYASNITKEKNPLAIASVSPRARTPSPDFYILPTENSTSKGNSTPPFRRPIRRSSSMQRLLGRINARTVQPKPKAEHLECWKVGVGSTAVGFKTAPQFLHYKRGQLQLRKMAEVFKEADNFVEKPLSEADMRAKLILKKKNENEKKTRSGRKWYLVAGRAISRDHGRTGMVSVEKAIIILVRR